MSSRIEWPDRSKPPRIFCSDDGCSSRAASLIVANVKAGTRSCDDSARRSSLSSGYCAPSAGARERRREVNRMLKFFARLRREEGQAMVEYALILALVSVVSILALTAIFDAIAGKLGEVVIP